MLLPKAEISAGVSTTTYYLNKSADSGGQTLSLTFPSGLPETQLRTGDNVTVQGQLTGESIEVQLLQPLVPQDTFGSVGVALSTLEAAPAIEDRRAVIIIVDMLDAVNSLNVKGQT